VALVWSGVARHDHHCLYRDEFSAIKQLSRALQVMSALRRLADSSRTSRHVRKVPILLQKVG
jgi:hypothetical protein